MSTEVSEGIYCSGQFFDANVGVLVGDRGHAVLDWRMEVFHERVAETAASNTVGVGGVSCHADKSFDFVEWWLVLGDGVGSAFCVETQESLELFVGYRDSGVPVLVLGSSWVGEVSSQEVVGVLVNRDVANATVP